MDGAGSALNVTDTINMYWKDLEVRDGGTVNATKVVSGGYAETAFILDGGTANISGTFTNNGKTANGGGLIIKNGGLLNLTGSNTIDGSGEIVISSGEIKTSDNTLALTGKTLNYSGGTLPETLKLTNTVLNISNTAAWNVTSVQELGDKNSLISVLFAAPTDGSTSGTVLESTDVSTFETSDVTLTFTSGGENLRPIVSGTSANGIAYTLEQTNNLILTREKTETPAGTFTELGALQKGDHILMTNNVTVDAYVTLPETLTIEGNSTEGRTINIQNSKDPMFYLPEEQGSSSLKLQNLKLTGGNTEYVWGGVIFATCSDFTVDMDNVSFVGNKAEGPGGAIGAYTATLTLNGNSLFENNQSGQGGAVGAIEKLTLNGNHTFSNNIATIDGGALWTQMSTISIAGNNQFKNNTAKNSGGAIYSLLGNVVFSGDGSVANFEGNTANDLPNDIKTQGSVIVKDKGTYTFGGGILSKKLSITDGADVTFGKDSLTSVNKLTTDEESTIHGNINVGKDGTEAGAVNVKDAFAIDGFTGTKEDGVKIDGDINFADGAKIEISFGEGLDFAFDGEYTLLTSNNILTETDLNNIEFSFVNAVDGMQERGLFEIKPGLHGEMMLNITGLSSVPEPTTWALLVLGGLGIFGIARKNRKAKK